MHALNKPVGTYSCEHVSKEVFISVLNHHTYNLGKKPDVKCDES